MDEESRQFQERVLASIPPSKRDHQGTVYFACSAITVDGEYLPRIIFINKRAGYNIWGNLNRKMYVDSDEPHPMLKCIIELNRIASVSMLAERIPVDIINQIHDNPETGCGQLAFVLKFRDGQEVGYWGFSLDFEADFLQLPDGFSGKDVVSVGFVKIGPIDPPPIEDLPQARTFPWDEIRYCLY